MTLLAAIVIAACCGYVAVDRVLSRRYADAGAWATLALVQGLLWRIVEVWRG